MSQEELTVMFTGNVTHKLDPKSRVAVPASWAAARDNTLILMDAKTEGYPVVKCYTRSSFAAQMARIRRHLEAINAQPGQIDQYVGKIIGVSYEAEVSSQGKLLIPKKQREALKLQETAALVGRGDYFEIWAPADFEATNAPEALAALEFDKMFNMLSS